MQFMNESFIAKIKKRKVPLAVVLFVIVLAVITIIGVVAWAPARDEGKSKEGNDDRATEIGFVRMIGELVCLPHHDTEGPQTLECASGVKVGDDYYALKGDSQSTVGMPFNEPVEVSGKLAAETSNLYKIQGSINVTSLLKYPSTTP
jgi:hypothetical protein